MTIGSEIAAVLPELRAMAESLMSLTVTAYKPGKGTVNGYETTVYTSQGTSAAKVNGTSATGRDTVSRTIMIGEVARPVIEGGLHLPLDSFVTNGVLGIVASDQRGTAWEFVVDAAPDPADAVLVGRRYMVTNCPAKSFATARRLDVVEVPAP